MRDFATSTFGRVPGKGNSQCKGPEAESMMVMFKGQLGGQSGWSRIRDVKSGKM